MQILETQILKQLQNTNGSLSQRFLLSENTQQGISCPMFFGTLTYTHTQCFMAKEDDMALGHEMFLNVTKIF